MPKRTTIADAEDSVLVDVSATLTRFQGLSSEGVIQALADSGKDSMWLARELVTMYEGTDNQYYKKAALSMITDLLKQKEGQKIHVDAMAQKSDAELQQMQVAATKILNEMLEAGQIDAKEIANVKEQAGLLPGPGVEGPAKPRRAKAGKRRKGKARKRNA